MCLKNKNFNANGEIYCFRCEKIENFVNVDSNFKSGYKPETIVLIKIRTVSSQSNFHIASSMSTAFHFE